MSLVSVTREIIEDMPAEYRFLDRHGAVITKYAETLRSFGGEFVQGFYDTVFGNDNMQAVFKEGERPAREQSLAFWWDRTVDGPFDDTYWTWQTYVGLMHIKRGVRNPMMIGMWGYVLSFLRERLGESGLPVDERLDIIESFQRLAFTCQALISDSVMRFYLEALIKATGFNRKLLDRMVLSEVDDLISENEQYRIKKS